MRFSPPGTKHPESRKQDLQTLKVTGAEEEPLLGEGEAQQGQGQPREGWGGKGKSTPGLEMAWRGQWDRRSWQLEECRAQRDDATVHSREEGRKRLGGQSQHRVAGVWQGIWRVSCLICDGCSRVRRGSW